MVAVNGCPWPDHFGKYLALSTKAEHTYILGPNNFTCMYVSNRNSWASVHKDMYKNLQSTIIHNRPNCKQSTVYINSKTNDVHTMENHRNEIG